MSIGTENIRNLAIVGHGGTGKTSLTEQMLFVGGAIPKPEPVESGRTVSDFIEEEISQKISIKTSLSHLPWEGNKINILDTPGSADFFGEVIAALRASECACILVGAKAGVQIETIKVWRRLEQLGKPRLVFINKMEREQADYKKVLDDLRERFKRPFVPVTVPVGSASEFKGVIDLLENRFYPMAGSTGEEKGLEIPSEYEAIKKEYHTLLLESAAEGDDDLMNIYFEKGTLSAEEIRKGLSMGLRNNRLIPVLCGSALGNSGIRSLLNFISHVVPSPVGFEEKALSSNGEEQKVPIHKDAPLSAFCFKTTIDQFSGQLSYLKVVTGKLIHDNEVFNPREGKKERVTKVYTALGKKLVEISEAQAGDICILAKLSYTHTNDTLCAQEKPIQYKPLELPTPVFSIAVAAVAKKDEDKLSQLLLRAAEEDKTFRIEYNPETKETIISGMGELQINMILTKIRDGQKIEINTRVPKVAYRETITKNSDAVYRHKKQTGGHGQFAEVSIQVRPLPRGEYYSFENAIRGMADR
ncbi:MAG: elongation factor G, partial [Spirochaetales bacterium]